jgi:hypothetical protein
LKYILPDLLKGQRYSFKPFIDLGITTQRKKSPYEAKNHPLSMPSVPIRQHTCTSNLFKQVEGNSQNNQAK